MLNDSAIALRIHLETQAQHRRALPPAWTSLFAGGRGLAAKIITELPTDMSPMAAENPLILAPGLLHGTGATGTAGCFVSALSPLTRKPAHGWSEGDIGTAIKRIGLSLILLVGIAPEWSVVVITPDGAEVVPAGALCGQDTIATAAALRTLHGRDARVLALGPAGEAGVAYAAPVVDGRYLVEPAGVGAVMAAKRIKAIVIRGGQAIHVHDPDNLRRLGRKLEQRTETEPLAKDIRRFGSAAYINLLNEHGALTPRNGQEQVFKGMLALSRSTLGLRGKQEWHGACALPCHADFVQRNGSPLPRPDLEALLGFGVRCDIADLEVVLLANERCLRLGLDVTATADAIAFLMECQQQGLHRTPALPWSNGNMLLELIDKIGAKEGVGGVLSLGVSEMQSIFYGSDRWAPQAYGGALTPIDPRQLPVLKLHLATSTWPGDYRMALPLATLLPQPPAHLPDFTRATDLDPDVANLLWHERFAAAVDALGICRRWALLAYAVTPAEVAELATYATGTAWTPAALAKLGERILTLERMALVRDGVEDRLAQRWSDGAGGLDDHSAPLEQMLQRYYAAHGWDTHGQPEESRLRTLELVS